jgi:hypothetical protein
MVKHQQMEVKRTRFDNKAAESYHFRSLYGIKLRYSGSQSTITDVKQLLRHKFPKAIIQQDGYDPIIWSMIPRLDLEEFCCEAKKLGAIGVDLYDVFIIHTKWGGRYPKKLLKMSATAN